MNLINHRDVFYVKDKGITLIALVITVIVLIILAGVAISMLSGENGILNQAAHAKQETEEQSALEKLKLAVNAAMTNEDHQIIKNTLEEELLKYGYNILDEDEGNNYSVKINDKTYYITNNGDIMPLVNTPPTIAVDEKTIFKDESSINSTIKTVVIPEGFRISKKEEEQKIDTGVVVIAPDESEFVWIPVDNPSSMYGIDEDGNYLGKLYNFNEDGTTSQLNWKEENEIMSLLDPENYREPDITGESENYGDYSENGLNLLKNIVGIQGEDDEEILDAWKKQLQSEFNEMVKSVEKYNGFYISRYEISVDETTSKVQSKSGKVVLNGAKDSNTWYGLYVISKTFQNNNVQSSMMWDCQYDQMMIWITKNNIDVTKAVDENVLNKSLITGNKTTDIINNIYDLYGNLREWTIGTGHYYGTRTFRRKLVCYDI